MKFEEMESPCSIRKVGSSTADAREDDEQTLSKEQQQVESKMKSIAELPSRHTLVKEVMLRG